MGLREAFRPIADSVRAITGPGALDIRTMQCTVRLRTWAGGRPGAAGTAVHLYPSTLRAASSTNAVTQANLLRSAYIAHAADAQAHQIPDTVDTVTAPVATDQATAITLANNLKAVWNAHVANTSVHYNADATDVVTAADATNAGTLTTLLAAELAAFNAHFALSAVSDSDLVLPQQYRIRQISQREIADSGGRYENGDVIVEHITPYDGVSVGFTVAQLKPRVTSDAVERIYIISSDDPAGGHTGEYDLRELRSWRALSFDLVLKRRENTP